MKIEFTLNGKEVSTRCRPDIRVSTILRENFEQLKMKDGYFNGQCGSSNIIYNGELVPAALLPSFKLKGAKIITEEGFSKFEERQTIIKALKKLDVELCDFCKAGRLLSIYYFLEKNNANVFSTQTEILESLSGNRCNCVDPWTLIEVVKECQNERRRKMNVYR